MDWIDLDQFYQARDFINRIRARTFPPYNGHIHRRKWETLLPRTYNSRSRREENGLTDSRYPVLFGPDNPCQSLTCSTRLPRPTVGCPTAR
ncbi:hypothetical protein AB1K70_20140 [Bremerella sp. JC770]|uniref:hypothetical protein n=1 Tax=Bremerella sp. JC770 TaxID=3232137 RepID=UPI0034583355